MTKRDRFVVAVTLFAVATCMLITWVVPPIWVLVIVCCGAGGWLGQHLGHYLQRRFPWLLPRDERERRGL